MDSVSLHEAKQSTQITADVYVTASADCDIIHRDEKRYARIKSLNIQLHITHLKVNGTYENIGPFLSGILEEIIDSNWKILVESINPDLEIYMGDIIKSAFTPIFDKIALEEFYDGQSDLEAFSIVFDPKDSSSSSSSVVQKLISCAVIWSTLLLTNNFPM